MPAHIFRRVWQYPLSIGLLGPWDLTILDIHDDQVRTGLVDASDDDWDAVNVIIETSDEAAVNFADDGFDSYRRVYDCSADKELSSAIWNVIEDPGVFQYANVKEVQQRQRLQQVKKCKCTECMTND